MSPNRKLLFVKHGDNIATRAELSCVQWLGYLDCYRKPAEFSAVWAYNNPNWAPTDPPFLLAADG
jgi:hypothetical protein